MIRVAQLALALAAAGLWGASQMTWVEVISFDGLGEPKTTELNGTAWSPALVPIALLLLAAAVAALAVRGWPLRLLAILVAAAGGGTAYLAISLWAVEDVGARATQLAEVPVTDLVDTQRHYGGAVVTLVAAAITLVSAVMLMRSARKEESGASRYTRRPAPAPDDAPTSEQMSERAIWDALDEGHDPTNPDNQGR